MTTIERIKDLNTRIATEQAKKGEALKEFENATLEQERDRLKERVADKMRRTDKLLNLMGSYIRELQKTPRKSTPID